MCGIVGIFSRRNAISAELIERATESLYHRGPDGQQHWIGLGGRVALGRARLSIIDLATGDQPIASEDGRTRIVVNGEFYGYESIQKELEQAGHRPRTRSDSEIALHLYEDFGTQCEVSSLLYSGTTQIASCLQLVIDLASSLCSIPSTMKRSIWPLK
jgi:asparagine synthase (glutamine-hydrolysing)